MSEEELLPIKVGDVSTDLPRPNLSLAGRLHSEKTPNFEGFKTALKRDFSTSKGLEIESVGDNIFLFHVSHSVDRDHALLGGLWNFDRQLLVLKELHPDISPSNLDFNFSPFYVRILDLPIEKFLLQLWPS